MITKKEDLINTYIENDFGELRDLYLAKCNTFGLHSYHDGRQSFDANFYDGECIRCDKFSLPDSEGVLQRCQKSDLGEYNERELTLSDLKPRTRTEYEKVTESIFDLKEEFERGELFNDALGINKINSLTYMAASFESGSLYRRVEVEIDERQEFVERAKGFICFSKTDEFCAGQLFDAGCRFQD